MSLRNILFIPALLLGGLMAWTSYSLYGMDAGVAALISVTMGGLLNGAAIFSNGGKMPVRGWNISRHSRTHTNLTERTRLKWLCDVFSVGDLFAFSAGDVLVWLAFVIGVGNSVYIWST